jgi:hypothetical protein
LKIEKYWYSISQESFAEKRYTSVRAPDGVDSWLLEIQSH